MTNKYPTEALAKTIFSSLTEDEKDKLDLQSALSLGVRSAMSYIDCVEPLSWTIARTDEGFAGFGDIFRRKKNAEHYCSGFTEYGMIPVPLIPVHPALYETKIRKICDLPLGARFSYEESPHVTWVMIDRTGRGLCARWEGATDDRVHQSICSIAETDEQFQSMEVIVRDPIL